MQSLFMALSGLNVRRAETTSMMTTKKKTQTKIKNPYAFRAVPRKGAAQRDNNQSMYTLKMMARDSYRSLRTHRTRARHNRWRNAAWFRPALMIWAVITLPIKAVLYSRANQSIVAAFGLSTLAVTSFA
jgi:hypothetical protein